MTLVSWWNVKRWASIGESTVGKFSRGTRYASGRTCIMRDPTYGRHVGRDGSALLGYDPRMNDCCSLPSPLSCWSDGGL
jgi:hypothetical protein